MILKVDSQHFLVLDLDDTIYKELEFLRSGYRHIASLLEPKLNKNIYGEMFSWYSRGLNTFDKIKQKYNPPMTIQELVYEYRSHFPDISLDISEAVFFRELNDIGIRLGLITDGRSKSQRNKLKALCIEGIFEDILISEEFGTEKPHRNNFAFFSEKYPNFNFIYIGDNFNKDFITPKKMGWITIGLLDDGRNIHKQNFDLPLEYHPHFFISQLSDLKFVIK